MKKTGIESLGDIVQCICYSFYEIADDNNYEITKEDVFLLENLAIDILRATRDIVENGEFN